MSKNYKFILSTLIIAGSLYNVSNAQNMADSKYETFTRLQPRSINIDIDMPKEVKSDIESLNDIKYLILKTNSKYEIAYAHQDGSYTYISNAQNIEDAISLANQSKNLKSNDIPVVINEDGLIVYATSGIGRIVKIKNGQVDTSLSNTTNIYRNSNLSSPEHTSINHGFIDDAPIIEDNGNIVKVEVNGYTGYIKKQESDGSLNIITVPMNQVKNLSYFSINSQRELVHNISSDITTANKTNAINLGPAPSFIKSGTKYYSYDGMYFYTNINTLISDIKSNHHKNAINSNSPYYNYYLQLPGRSKTSYSANDINKYFENNTPSDSVLRNSGKYFIEAQEKYGVNATMLLGIAMNESARGTSDIAKTKFNIFGANAKDGYPQGADKFSSIQECIMRVANYSFSNNYLNPKSWKYNNSNLGNKSFGMNVRYASDPYWGEKAVNNMHSIDKYFNKKDYNKYTLGMYTSASNIYNNSNDVLYKILGANSRKNIYGSNPSLGQVGDTTIILSAESDRYKIQPDRGVPVTSSNTNGDGTYIWNKIGYVSSSNVKILNKNNNSESDTQHSFTDIKNHWAKSTIKDFVDKGYVNGYSDNTFKPNNDITRAEFVVIVNNVFGLTKSSGKIFNDTKSHWAKSAIDIAITNGVCSGKSTTEFKPNDKITREEASVIISNYKKISDINLDKLNKYKDANKVSSWAKSSVEGMIENGYMGGYSDNTFRPKDKITRAEAVVTLSRVR